jgi:hypothetical protein
MSSHRQGGHPRPRPPNWLKAFYALLIFASFVVALTVLTHYK